MLRRAEKYRVRARVHNSLDICAQNVVETTLTCGDTATVGGFRSHTPSPRATDSQSVHPIQLPSPAPRQAAADDYLCRSCQKPRPNHEEMSPEMDEERKGPATWLSRQATNLSQTMDADFPATVMSPRRPGPMKWYQQCAGRGPSEDAQPPVFRVCTMCTLLWLDIPAVCAVS